MDHATFHSPVDCPPRFLTDFERVIGTPFMRICGQYSVWILRFVIAIANCYCKCYVSLQHDALFVRQPPQSCVYLIMLIMRTWLCYWTQINNIVRSRHLAHTPVAAGRRIPPPLPDGATAPAMPAIYCCNRHANYAGPSLVAGHRHTTRLPPPTRARARADCCAERDVQHDATLLRAQHKSKRCRARNAPVRAEMDRNACWCTQRRC